MNNKLIQKKVNFIFKNGYCVINNILSQNQCFRLKKNILELQTENKVKKFFKDKDRIYGQEVIRDLVLRKPKQFLKIINLKMIMVLVNNILRDKFILDNCMASNSILTKNNYKRVVHIDSHLPISVNESTTDVVVCFCLDDFKKENGATKIWPKSHLSGFRIQNSKYYSKLIKKKHIFCEAKSGSVIIFLGQSWHQIGKNINGESRWSILCHYKKWWIKPSTDFTACGKKIFDNLDKKQKELFGFTSISPKFSLRNKSRALKTLRNVNKLPNNYFKTLSY